MFKRLIAKNFQKWDVLTVDFDDQLSTIIGVTDAGKSSALRALEWVCLNQPDGDSYIRRGQSNPADVTLYLSSGDVIRRVRGKSTNSYFLNGDEYKAFGRGVPDAIAKVLNVCESNFQAQLDQIYWISLSASEVSRQLNAVVDLGVIDDSLESIGRVMRTAKATAEVSRTRLKEAKEKKLSLDWVVEADKGYREVERLEEIRDAVVLKKSRLQTAIQDVRTADDRLRLTRDIAEAGRLVVDAAVALRTVSQRKEMLRDLIDSARQLKVIASREVPDFSPVESACDKVERISNRKFELKRQIDSLQRLKSLVTRVIPDFSEVERTYQTYVTVQRRRMSLENLITELRSTKSAAAVKKNYSDDLEDQVAAESVDRCPVCGNQNEKQRKTPGNQI